ncbi:MAG: plasmid maintenance protein CcdB [Phyllobacteriaceae bacterium]|nr:plasmid maintenance protein CcdB [Phyllobacteriaceae bacterium]
MARFDVYPALDGGRGYLLDVQSNTLSALKTRVVIPLLAEKDFVQPARRLNPTVMVGGTRHILATEFMGTVPKSELSPAIATLADDSDAITTALDMLLFGF